MDLQLGINTAALDALGRLCGVAKRDSGQSRRVANFLLAWHNAPENGGWDRVDLWNLDIDLAQDVLTVLALALQSSKYPGDLGFEPEMQTIWQRWRGRTQPVVDQLP